MKFLTEVQTTTGSSYFSYLEEKTEREGKDKQNATALTKI